MHRVVIFAFVWLPAVLSGATSPASKQSPNGKFAASVATVTETVDGHTFTHDVVDVRDAKGEAVARSPINGRVVSEFAWSPDSRFIVATTKSSEGHSPWHCATYCFDLPHRKLYYLDNVIGPVIDPRFSFEPPDVLVITVQDWSHGKDAPDDPKKVRAKLSRIVSKAKET